MNTPNMAASTALGAGLVEIPTVPGGDPSCAVLGTDAIVPESLRRCVRCGEPVGRSRDGTPGRTTGFCPDCGEPFSFEPKLAPGELVADQYEVAGCLAHGGMGWIYLARDHHVSDRWVVLKGVLNAGDADAVAAALAERRFLAEVEHPNIVKIFNFVQHEDAGYIVMEYVGGLSLKQILAARREANGGEPDPLPPAQAIAYVLEILPALGYLHELGLVFCDFKDANVIQTQRSLKLIDLGSVCRIGDSAATVFGTPGYQAPEVADTGPTVVSDLFTVARTLALLCADLPGYQSAHRFALPPQESVPVFARHDSLYRFLLMGSAPDPRDRFQSAEAMADQLYGVLRELVDDDRARPLPVVSKLFSGAVRGYHERPDAGALPHPLLDVPGVKVELRLASARIELADLAGAAAALAEVQDADPRDWRARWYRGVVCLERGQPADARSAFAAVYQALPGELAPKLALGLSYELDGRTAEAARWYEIVSRTDPAFTSATFGLARCLLATGDRAGALAAYDRVPDSSSAYVEAQTARLLCLIRDWDGDGAATAGALLAAAATLESLALSGAPRTRLEAQLFEAAIALTAREGALEDNRATLLGRRFRERDLRLGAERSYRELARWASSGAERIALVDRANRVRPRTWT
ncbi:MAG TPA: tetratricopeptide repeat protein [Solirubrobacteraceae bacterium]|nr:tetratricopeptide repeat protein [Solirubrobacteraceae bacterium]